MQKPELVADILIEAIPYINRYIGKTVVVKMGGSTMDSDQTVLQDVATLKRLGINPVLVHGGGPEISEWMRRVDKQPQFVDGLRVTDQETLDIATMGLRGKVNAELVAMLNGMGAPAVGLCGADAGLFQAVQRDVRLGYVGDISRVDLRILSVLTGQGYLPVVAPIGLGEGGRLLNINGDTAAGELAAAISAEKLIFFTDVAGIQDSAGNLLVQLTTAEAQGLISSGTVTGGMIPKVKACVKALSTVGRTHIIDGRVPHALLRELFTDSGVGTMIVAS
ncbi:MAG TPA: acetylglutamate kinase [Chloroflexota bacterium]|nr:acetylglutamate kinase [Chloroflexota bacterium]